LKRDNLRRVLIAVGIALVGSLALIFSLLSLPVAPKNIPVAAPHAAKPAWVEIAKSFRLFALIGADWGREPTMYTVEGHNRIDLVSAGDDTELRRFFTGAASELGAACRNPTLRPQEGPRPSMQRAGLLSCADRAL
jgi:hypothetical protein